MEKEKYYGKGWETQYGINISVNLKDIQSLPVDAYGNIKLFVGKRKSQDEKSKATHFVKESKPYEKKESSSDSGLPF